MGSQFIFDGSPDVHVGLRLQTCWANEWAPNPLSNGGDLANKQCWSFSEAVAVRRRPNTH
ncbi:MAG: hypothetical protein ACKER6_01090 [Candidatus Hodgkinia cicadicola]